MAERLGLILVWLILLALVVGLAILGMSPPLPLVGYGG